MRVLLGGKMYGSRHLPPNCTHIHVIVMTNITKCELRLGLDSIEQYSTKVLLSNI